MKNTFRILIALMCLLGILAAGAALAEEAPAPEPTPTFTPIPTPSAEDLGKLEIQITGPDGEVVATVKYSDFTEGKYSLEGLEPGTYTVTEVDPDKLLEGLAYEYDEENSVRKVEIEVTADAVSTETLKNVYERTVEVTPTPTPEPSETPTPTPTPTPVPDEKFTIPVSKIWEDQGNQDRNRPDRAIVNLMANGSKVAQAALSEANGWKYEFADMPKYNKEGREIVYTVTEDAVPMYETRIEGFTVTNVYRPETTSATVSKVWMDNDNAANLRPASIYCTLSNGIHVELNEANSWTATVENLPAIVNGQRVTYTWSEQEAIGYRKTEENVVGTTTVFTNTLIERGNEEPPEGKTPPQKKRGKNYLVIEEYGTPLGVEVAINHVGDCYD